MQRSAPYLRLIFRFCDFLILVLPLYYFLGGCWGSLGPATASERRVTIHCKYAGIGVLASYDFSTWPLLKCLKSALLLFWGPGCTRGLPRNFSFRFSSPLNLFASSPLRFLALRKPLFFYLQDLLNVSADLLVFVRIRLMSQRFGYFGDAILPWFLRNQWMSERICLLFVFRLMSHQISLFFIADITKGMLTIPSILCIFPP